MASMFPIEAVERPVMPAYRIASPSPPASPPRPCMGCSVLGYDAQKCRDYHLFASRATPGVKIPTVKIEVESDDGEGVFTDELKGWLNDRQKPPRGRRPARRQQVGPPVNNPRATAVPRAAYSSKSSHNWSSILLSEGHNWPLRYFIMMISVYPTIRTENSDVSVVTPTARPVFSFPAEQSASAAPAAPAFLKDTTIRLEEKMAAMEQQYEMRISALERHIEALKKALE
ncbi:hypothetical protein N7540_000043 [Penicillium herquei]|nr:hypothetical protein N7540_000043 [Penicillium herquei]